MNVLANNKYDVYYFKDFDGTKYRINAKEYLKKVKMYGIKLDISKHLVIRRQILSFFDSKPLHNPMSYIFLSTSPNGTMVAAITENPNALYFLVMHPSLREIKISVVPREITTISTAFSENGNILAFSFKWRNNAFRFGFTSLKHNITLLNLTVPVDNSKKEEQYFTASDDTVAIFLPDRHSGHIFRLFDDKKFLPNVREYQWSPITIYRCSTHACKRRQSTFLEAHNLSNENVKAYEYYENDEAYEDDVFVVSYDLQLRVILVTTIAKRYKYAGKYISEVKIIESQPIILGHDKDGAHIAIHAIFNSPEYPNRYYSMISCWIPFFTTDITKCKIRLGELRQVSNEKTLESLFKSYPELLLKDQRLSPYSSFSHYLLNVPQDSMSSLEPLKCGFEYTIEKPKREDIANYPWLDLSRFFP